MSATARHSAAAGIIGAVVLSLNLALNSTAFAEEAHPHPQPTPAGTQQATGAGGTAEKPKGGSGRGSEAQHKSIDCANFLTGYQVSKANGNMKEANGYWDMMVARGC